MGAFISKLLDDLTGWDESAEEKQKHKYGMKEYNRYLNDMDKQLNNIGINNIGSLKSLKSNLIPRETLRRGVYLATGKRLWGGRRMTKKKNSKKLC
jgi:hypothetical protein